MEKTRGEQLSLRFESSKIEEDALKTESRSATVVSLASVRREAQTKQDEQRERSLLERALQSVRLFN